MITGYYFTMNNTISAANGGGTEVVWKNNPRIMGIITDSLSVVFLCVMIYVGFISSNCVYVEESAYYEMRLSSPIGTMVDTVDTVDIDDLDIFQVPTNGGDTYINACGITYHEFIDYVYNRPTDLLPGRFVSKYTIALAYFRWFTPLLLCWIYTMSYGYGITASIFNLKVFQWLGPQAYSLYLLHIPISIYYWMITRDIQSATSFYNIVGEYPLPVQWYETIVIIIISVIVGLVLDKYIVKRIQPYTIQFGIYICSLISSSLRHVVFGIKKVVTTATTTKSSSESDTTTDDGETSTTTTTPTTATTKAPTATTTTIFNQVQLLVQRLTGQDVNSITNDTELKNLGLDSLGATALLSLLKVTFATTTVPAIKNLTMRELIDIETVGDLVDLLGGKRRKVIYKING